MDHTKATREDVKVGTLLFSKSSDDIHVLRVVKVNPKSIGFVCLKTERKFHPKTEKYPAQRYFDVHLSDEILPVYSGDGEKKRKYYISKWSEARNTYGETTLYLVPDGAETITSYIWLGYD